VRRKTAVDKAGPAGEEWLDRQIAVLRELVEADERARLETLPPEKHPPRPRQTAQWRADLPRSGPAIRALATPLATGGSFATRLVLAPIHLFSAVGSALRSVAAEIAWGATAICIGVAVGVGVPLLLR
jgi:hypothetical protein